MLHSCSDCQDCKVSRHHVPELSAMRTRLESSSRRTFDTLHLPCTEPKSFED